MPELKRNFSAAKMNKDLDERLIPPGQYRDALNVQVATSDGSNVGSLQTLLGNTIKNTMASDYDSANSTAANAFYEVPTTAACVGSIALPDKDKVYYMVAAGLNVSANTTVSSHGTPAELDIQKDYILEYDTIKKTLKYVFVDIYRVKETLETATTVLDSFLYIPDLGSSTINKTGVRIGMTVIGTMNGVTYTESDQIKVSNVQYDINKFKISLTKDGADFIPTNGTAIGDIIQFKADRVLNFNYNNIITGINVLDDMLFWTDNATEPKKINIKRSKAGTGGVEYLVGGGVSLGAALATGVSGDIFDGDTPYFHTRLVTDADNDGFLQVVISDTGNRAVYVEKKHITVIRKAPTQPLELEMSRVQSDRTNSSGGVNPSHTTINSTNFYNSTTNQLLETGDEIDITFDTAIDFRVGDTLFFVSEDDAGGSAASSFLENIAQVRGTVVESKVTDGDSLFADGFKVRLFSINQNLPTTGNEKFYVRREAQDPLFEFKFVRFSYRYKYQDGEYSSFAPFSEIAFLPGEYSYEPKKGLNNGMKNTLKSLKVKQYYHKKGIGPEDVVEIDILYKETNNPTVYVYKTIKPTDPHPVWPDFSKSGVEHRGELEVTKELVHALVPSNQLLRPYDNVPRIALAQEITANRLVYANYLQGYTVQRDPVIELALITNPKNNISGLHGVSSVKSIRTYQLGIAFSDDYGRETPVLTNKDASITIPKTASSTRNRILAKLGMDTEIPAWAKYYTWYIKEPTPEYYNLAMDRFYSSSDGNIWLSFPSADRNKIDEETFLILKKQHGTSKAVVEKARYKVLAIENEAPDHIKTEKKSLGRLTNNTANDLIGESSNDGFPMKDNMFVTLDKAAFDKVFGLDIIINTPDKLVLQVGAASLLTEFYEVSHISRETGANKVKLNLKRPIGEDADFTSTNQGGFNAATSNLHVELFEFEVENRAEFDGRFFVKIYKDEFLEANVLALSSNPTSYIVDDSEKVYYLNNNYDNSAVGAQALGWGSFQLDPFGSTLPTMSFTDATGSHPTQRAHLNTAALHAYNWADASTSGVGAENVFGISAADMATNTVGALNNLGVGNNSPSFFWQSIREQKNFFIDACSAYSIDAKTIPGQYKDGIATGADDSYASTSSYAVANQQNYWALDGDPANTKKQGGTTCLGQVSRGIWGNGKYMDISWVGPTSDSGTLGDAPQKFADSYNTTNPLDQPYKEAKNFISKLVTPGTKFKFANDPDEQVYTVEAFFYNSTHPDGISPVNGQPAQDGTWGIRNYATTAPSGQYVSNNLRQRWTIKVSPAIGSQGLGYCPTKGTNSTATGSDITPALHHDFTNNDVIQILKAYTDVEAGSDTFSDNPAVWETEPKESVDLDIYYEASGKIPLALTDDTNEEYLPIGTTFKTTDIAQTSTTHTIDSWTSADTIHFTPSIPTTTSIADGQDIFFTKRNNYSLSALHKTAGGSVTNFTGAVGQSTPTGGPTVTTDHNTLKLYGAPQTTTQSYKMFRRYQVLDWSNCYCFGNGVESDRIRDDFNAAQLDNGVKASATLAESVKEERRKHGLIYSGIYNSQSGVNNTNQFIQAEKITKDLNPVYGSIQKLHARNTNLITLCEDKVLNILSNKDALFNADGNSNVTATAKVLGSATPYSGNYGISTNPESFAATPYQVFFSDAMRGMVLMLAGNAITPISDLGMKDYFSDNLKTYVDKVIGSYDAKKHEYNLTIAKRFSKSQVIPTFTTLSYSEKSKGWTSFKSFHPETGISLNNDFYSFKAGQLYIHHNNTTRNNFYGVQYDSDVTLVFNDNPTMVKSFNTVNYEGTQAKVTVPATTSISDAAGNTVTSTAIKHNEYFNLTAKNGWYVDSIETNKQTGGVVEFKEKEGKWFGNVCGDTTTVTNLDEKEFSVQGLGTATFTHSSPAGGGAPSQGSVTITIANNTSTSYVGDDGSGSVWDATAD